MTSRPNDSISSARAMPTTTTANGPRHEAGCRERQSDPRVRRDDLAPVAGRKLRSQPRQRPAGRDEGVAHQPDRDHPPAESPGVERAQHQQEEGVDLHVVAGSQRALAMAAPGQPAVDRIQQQCGDRDRDEQGCRGRLGERRHGDGGRPRRRASNGWRSRRSRSRGAASPRRASPTVSRVVETSR